jgi:hypothetical protein
VVVRTITTYRKVGAFYIACKSVCNSNRDILLLRVYRPSGHAASLKYVSTVMHHSARSHSRTKYRFLFCSHQARSAADEVYSEPELHDPQFELSGERRGGRNGTAPIGISAFASHSCETAGTAVGRDRTPPLLPLQQENPR